jgi:hypothetical protein
MLVEPPDRRLRVCIGRDEGQAHSKDDPYPYGSTGPKKRGHSEFHVGRKRCQEQFATARGLERRTQEAQPDGK